MYHPIKKVFVILGTRPEAIKLSPVIRELRSKPDLFQTTIISTGQHREMLQNALDVFEIKPDIELDAMASAQSLAKLTARIFHDLDAICFDHKPDWILVQGDTTSAFVAAMVGFYQKIKIGHVEAGLRTYNRWSPFPEEINRTFISHLADLHFAPTKESASNLAKLNIPPDTIHITGNTIVDALLWASSKIEAKAPPPDLPTPLQDAIKSHRTILLTSHRRESFGEGLENICQAILSIVRVFPDVLIVYPVHLNPNVQQTVQQFLSDHPQVKLIPPISYLSLIWIMKHSYLILTDSGGIQEEAPTFQKPVLVMRENTERPEVIQAGCGKLVGTHPQNILAATSELLQSTAAYQKMSQSQNPFGDGHAAQRIVSLLH